MIRGISYVQHILWIKANGWRMGKPGHLARLRPKVYLYLYKFYI
jgi:hypothetical protein